MIANGVQEEVHGVLNAGATGYVEVLVLSRLGLHFKVSTHSRVEGF